MAEAPVRLCEISFDWFPFDTMIRRMSEAAVGAGHEVDVICLRQKGEKKFENWNGIVKTYRVPMDRGFGGSLPATILNWTWFMILAGLTVTRLHLKKPYDVIHVHNMPDFLVFATLIPKLLGAKVVLEVQDTCPELMAAKASGKMRTLVKFFATVQERISTAYVDHVITVGWPFEQLLLKRGLPAKKLTVILNSADPNIFPASRRLPLPSPEAPDPERPFVVVYHGTLAKRTGLDIAIRALVLARKEQPQIRLHIKGRGEFITDLKALASELGVNDAVEFTNPCAAEEMVDFIAQGDVGVIPYRTDGFEELVLPTKAYEYSWLRLPIIASNTAGIRSMFRPESIVLCEPEDVEAFAAAIVDLYRHPEKRIQMINSATEDYKPYSWEIMSQRFNQLLVTLQRKRAQKQAAKERQVARS